MSYYKNESGLSLAKGNLKLGNDTLIINMGSATQCPSAKKGLCKLGRKCYALKAEKVYPGCLPSRTRQEVYWLNTSAKQIARDIQDLSQKHKKAFASIKYIRFNESGDFHSQACVDKLDKVAGYIRATTGWIFYGYTARKDLNFSKVISFMVKGSSNEAGNNGRTIARHASKIAAGTIAQKDYVEVINNQNIAFKVCPGDCRKCELCKRHNYYNIVFPLH